MGSPKRKWFIVGVKRCENKRKGSFFFRKLKFQAWELRAWSEKFKKSSTVRLYLRSKTTKIAILNHLSSKSKTKIVPFTSPVMNWLVLLVWYYYVRSITAFFSPTASHIDERCIFLPSPAQERPEKKSTKQQYEAGEYNGTVDCRTYLYIFISSYGRFTKPYR
jgi:hypothetical protein